MLYPCSKPSVSPHGLLNWVLYMFHPAFKNLLPLGPYYLPDSWPPKTICENHESVKLNHILFLHLAHGAVWRWGGNYFCSINVELALSVCSAYNLFLLLSQAWNHQIPIFWPLLWLFLLPDESSPPSLPPEIQGQTRMPALAQSSRCYLHLKQRWARHPSWHQAWLYD